MKTYKEYAKKVFLKGADKLRAPFPEGSAATFVAGQKNLIKYGISDFLGTMEYEQESQCYFLDSLGQLYGGIHVRFADIEPTRIVHFKEKLRALITGLPAGSFIQFGVLAFPKIDANHRQFHLFIKIPFTGKLSSRKRVFAWAEAVGKLSAQLPMSLATEGYKILHCSPIDLANLYMTLLMSEHPLSANVSDLFNDSIFGDMHLAFTQEGLAYNSEVRDTKSAPHLMSLVYDSFPPNPSLPLIPINADDATGKDLPFASWAHSTIFKLNADKPFKKYTTISPDSNSAWFEQFQSYMTRNPANNLPYAVMAGAFIYDTPDRLEKSVAHLKNITLREDFRLSREPFIAPASIISSLPFSSLLSASTVEGMRRFVAVTEQEAVCFHLLPFFND